MEHYFALVQSITNCKDLFPMYSDSEDINIQDYTEFWFLLAIPLMYINKISSVIKKKTQKITSHYSDNLKYSKL